MDFKTFLLELSNKPTKVIAPDIGYNAYVPIDLSVNNKELKKIDIKCSDSWIKYIEYFLKSHHKSIAFGGYLECRNLYERSDYFN